MKILPFDSTNKDVMNLLYHALIIGRSYSTAESRVVNKIKRAFEKEADVVKEKRGDGRIGLSFKILCREGETKQIRLENAEFDLLQSVFDGIESWSGAQTEDVEEASNYLKSVMDLEDWEQKREEKEPKVAEVPK